MIYKNKNGSIYKIETGIQTEVPIMPLADESEKTQVRVYNLEKAIEEIQEVLNYLLEKEE